MTTNRKTVEEKRRKYNQFVATESIEDYALRYSPSKFRNWSELLIANTAIGSISFLALEAIGASIAINYGFQNAFWGILTASIIIFMMGIPISYHAAKHNIDIDLLTRAAGFGYLGSTFTSLIYASFCFIFFALEAAIMAQAIFLYTGLPLFIGYALCSIIIIPIVFYGITMINKLQLYTQPVWLTLMILPFVLVLLKEPELLNRFFNFSGTQTESSEFSFYHFGFALGISLSLIGQIGEQVDYLRFMPDKKDSNRVKWWAAVILAGPGWVILGFLKQIGGILLAALVLLGGASLIEAREPIYMYNAAYHYVFENPEIALTVSFIFVIISQIKINVTNAYAGSLAWSNFFSRTTHAHPGRVVWLVFNIAIALLLMEIGVFKVLEKILGLYSNVAIAWIAAIVADLVINKPFGLSPPLIEFKRAYLFNINPVGVFSTLIASVLSIVAFSGILGDEMQAFSSIVALITAFLCSPLIAYVTRGKYYLAREADTFAAGHTHQCGVCGIHYSAREMASCAMYKTNICSLCCSLEARCHDMCKDETEFSLRQKTSQLLEPLLQKYFKASSINRLINFVLVETLLLAGLGFILWTTYSARAVNLEPDVLIAVQQTYFNLFYILSLVSLVASWLIILMHENREFVESELTFKNIAFENELLERLKVEQKLKESEHQYRQIFQGNQAIQFIINSQDGSIIECNEAATQFYGYDEKTLASMKISQINTMSEEEARIQIEKIKGGEVSYFETQHQLASGEIREVEVYPCPIKTNSGILNYSIVFDITKRKQAEQALRQSELRFRKVFENTDVISVQGYNRNRQVIYWNPASETLYGYSADQAMGQKLEDLIIPNEMREQLTTAVTDWIQGGPALPSTELTLRKADGSPIDVFSSHVMLHNQHNEPEMYCIDIDISLRKQQEQKILHQAHFDNLTDLPNRFLSLDRLSQLINDAKRSKLKIAVMFLDLDDFKKINDTLGHETGDKLLIQAAQRLTNVLRDGDTVGRLGGDEFIILLGGLKHASEAQPIAENLLNKFRKAFNIDGRELVLTASIGIAFYPTDSDNASELLRNADSAMYHSKELGRNTYSFFTDKMNREVSRRLSIEEQILGALDRNEFNVVYQPKVNINSGNVMGAEALLRWNNPKLGEVSPEEFIPIAEQTGLIVSIGEYVLIEALKNVSQWQKQLFAEFHIAVNLSPRQFRDPDLVNMVNQSIKSSQVSAEYLELEITEGVLMSGHSYIDEALLGLNRLGVSIAMDDFGTGYSSLSYLRTYPFDVLKIDRSFINDITVDEEDRELINAAIAMAHGLKLKVVAEGVETEEQLAYLRRLRCDYAQGYLFSKPVSAKAITEILLTRK